MVMKRSLKNDGKQFNQYQKNKQSPVITPTHLTLKQTTAYDLRKKSSGLRLNRLVKS